MQLKVISLSKILKLELPELVNEVVRILEKYNPDDLGVRGVYNLLKNDQQQTKLLKVTVTSNPLTEKVQLLREKEFKCVGAIVSHMHFIVRADIESMRPAARIAMPVVKSYLHGLRKNNESVVNEIIHQFLELLNDHTEVYNALSDLGLQPFVDELKIVNGEKMKLVAKRDEYIAKNKAKANSRAVQKEARNNLKLMFDVIWALNASTNDPNFDSLISELNVLLIRYETIINTRKTHNRNRVASSVINLSNRRK